MLNMTGMAPRYLYLVRHGEALPDESGLTENGRRQAVLLGRRLRNSAISLVHHGPLPRAAQTAQLIEDQLIGATLHASEAAGDYPPHLPDSEELPPESVGFHRLLEQFTPEEGKRGQVLAHEALEQFTGPVTGSEARHELVVTHNFLAAWLLRDAMDAPKWRWLGLNHGNAALTVICYAPGRPAAILFHNDMRHLPTDLRWTGFPPELHL